MNEFFVFGVVSLVVALCAGLVVRLSALRCPHCGGRDVRATTRGAGVCFYRCEDCREEWKREKNEDNERGHG